MAMSEQEVVITGLGVVLPTGLSVAGFWEYALTGRSAIGALNSPTIECGLIRRFGNVAAADSEAARETVPFKLQRYSSQSTIWGVKAAVDAVQCAGLDLQAVPPGRRGVFTAQADHAQPSLTPWIRGMKSALGKDGLDMRRLTKEMLNSKGGDPVGCIKGLSNNLLAIVSIALQLKGDCGAHLQGDVGAIAALRSALSSLRYGHSDIAVVSCAGSYNEPFTLSEHVRLGQLDTSADAVIRPFDVNGQGTILGEGAAALVLEGARHAERRGARVLAQLGGIATQATILKEEENAYQRCIVRVLKRRGINLSTIDAICADGKGLAAQDLREGRMLETALEGHAAPVTSIKPANGSLSAAGVLLEVITGVLMLRHGTVPPVANLRTPLAARVNFVTARPMRKPTRRVLVMNASAVGFNAAVLLEAA
jgi:3-oxoacyl-[acyl-carrier-protein] synthase II